MKRKDDMRGMRDDELEYMRGVCAGLVASTDSAPELVEVAANVLRATEAEIARREGRK